MNKKELWIQGICSLFILLFTYTAFSKWFNFRDFLHSMKNQPFDKKYLPFLLYGIPSAELVTALLLIYYKTRRISLWISLGLMSAFTAYIILIKLNYYGRIPCSCGGVIKNLTWTQHLFFNLFFILLAVAGIILYKKDKSFNNTGLPSSM